MLSDNAPIIVIIVYAGQRFSTTVLTISVYTNNVEIIIIITVQARSWLSKFCRPLHLSYLQARLLNEKKQEPTVHVLIL